MAAVVFTGPGQSAGQALTGSRRLLLAAIDRFRGQQIGRRPPAASRHADEQATTTSTDQTDQSATRLDDPNDAERSFNARQTLNTLRDAARWIRRHSGAAKIAAVLQ
jgi:hypothetical protein